MKRSSKWATVLAGIAIFYFLYNPGARGEICNQIVAIINEEIVTQTELHQAMDSLQAEMDISASYFDPNQWKNKALQALIDEKLQLQEANKIGLSAYPEEIDQGIQDIKIKNGLTSDEEFEKALRNQNMAIQSLRNKVKESIILLKLRERSIRSKIHVTDAEISDYFDQYKKKDAMGIHLSHILFAIPDGADEATVDQVYNKAQQVWKELQEGKDFAEAAREYSQDSETARQGGDLGYLEVEQICVPFKKEIARLSSGQFSQPIRTSFGFHLIKVNDQQAPSLVKNSAKWHEIEEVLINQKIEQCYQQWLEGLRKRAYIEIK